MPAKFPYLFVLDEIKAGDILIADGDFQCLDLNERGLVKVDEDGHPYVMCFGPLEEDQVCHGKERKERHYLEGQYYENDSYIGFVKEEISNED